MPAVNKVSKHPCVTVFSVIWRNSSMLWDTDNSISRIAEKSGFGCQQYLNDVFRKNVGLTPRQYREEFAKKYSMWEDSIYDTPCHHRRRLAQRMLFADRCFTPRYFQGQLNLCPKQGKTTNSKNRFCSFTVKSSFAITLYRKRGLCENVRLKLNMIVRFRSID